MIIEQTSHIASTFYRKKFMFQLLWMIMVISLLSSAYHLYFLEYGAPSLELFLALVCGILLVFFSRLSLNWIVFSSMILTYGVIIFGMNINANFLVWMLTLPEFCFIALSKSRGFQVNILGFVAILISVYADVWRTSNLYSWYDGINILMAYLLLSYAALSFHKLTNHYKKSLAESVAEQRKLESTRTLSGGVAHLINNRMSVIVGHASLLTPKDSKQERYCKMIQDSAFEASKHANDLLAYAEQTISHYEDTVDVLTCVEEVLDTLNMQGIEFTLKQQAHHLPRVLGNKQQIISAVLQNVCLNAIEAKPKTPIEINIRTMDVNEDANLKSGKYVYIEIKDDGEGMTEESRKQAFNPFYSTKFLGRGMGLAAAFGAVKRHKGRIELKSQCNIGTTCQIWLPVA